MPPTDRRRRVAAHYDELSPYYRDLWGEHIHHGFYRRGDEGRREATENLVALVIEPLSLGVSDRVLDVGCGVGGTARLLRRRRGCRVIGVTLSRVQAGMARELGGAAPGSEPRFVVGDAAALPLRGAFDAIVAMEVLSHVEDRPAFFREAARLLRPGGRLGIAAWLKAADLGPREHGLIERIEEGMLVSLPHEHEYSELIRAAGLEPIVYRDVSREVAKTWDFGVEIVARPELWRLAARKGRDVVKFVRSFRDMQRGFERGAFRYAVIAAEKS